MPPSPVRLMELLGEMNGAIIGTPCGNIQQLAHQLINILSENWKVAYVDADHKESTSQNGQSALAGGAVLEYTDKISQPPF